MVSNDSVHITKKYNVNNAGMNYEGAGARVNFNFPEVAVSRVPGATRDVSKRDEQRCAEENLPLFCPLPRYIYDPRGRRPSPRP